MKLDDPFGRVSRNHQQAYLALREQLREQGVQDHLTLQGMARNTRVLLLRLLAIVAASAAVLIAILPETAIPVLVFAALVVLWLTTNYLQTRAYLRRYRLEELESGRH